MPDSSGRRTELRPGRYRPARLGRPARPLESHQPRRLSPATFGVDPAFIWAQRLQPAVIVADSGDDSTTKGTRQMRYGLGGGEALEPVTMKQTVERVRAAAASGFATAWWAQLFNWD